MNDDLTTFRVMHGITIKAKHSTELGRAVAQEAEILRLAQARQGAQRARWASDIAKEEADSVPLSIRRLTKP